MYLKITEKERIAIEELSALSGIQKDVIREVLEFLFIRWAEQIATNPEGMNNLHIPFLGTIGVRYTGDQIEESGALSTNVEAFVALDPVFKKLVGDTVDEGETVVKDLLKKKIDNALLTMKAN